MAALKATCSIYMRKRIDAHNIFLACYGLTLVRTLGSAIRQRLKNGVWATPKTLKEADARAIMNRIAGDYERLAKHAEKRRMSNSQT
jgi:hypothetical protein